MLRLPPDRLDFFQSLALGLRNDSVDGQQCRHADDGKAKVGGCAGGGGRKLIKQMTLLDGQQRYHTDAGNARVGGCPGGGAGI